MARGGASADPKKRKGKWSRTVRIDNFECFFLDGRSFFNLRLFAPDPNVTRI